VERVTFQVGDRVVALADTKTLTAGILYKVVKRDEFLASDNKPFFTYEVIDSTGKRVTARNGHISFKLVRAAK
jgi:hypothetical protein